MKDEFCDSPNCPVKNIESTLTRLIDNQDKFDKKQDEIISILAKQELLALEIKHMKENFIDFKKYTSDRFEEAKESKAKIWEKLNILEQSKQSKEESKEHRGWLFGGIILILGLLVDLIRDTFFK
jgi:hypothetical protein